MKIHESKAVNTGIQTVAAVIESLETHAVNLQRQASSMPERKAGKMLTDLSKLLADGKKAMQIEFKKVEAEL